MKLTMDLNKYRKKVLPFWFVSAIITVMLVLNIVMNTILNAEFNLVGIVVLALVFLLLIFFVSFARFFYVLKRKEYVMALENGVLINYGKPWIKPLFLPIEHVESIAPWGDGD